MTPRANWKGFLTIGELSCPVALYTAASTAERVSFHTLNRKTGHRVHRQFVDEETGAVVDHDDQVKGYETDRGDYIVLEPEEIAAVLPESDKRLTLESFVICDEIDDIYFDRPYYLTPNDEGGAEIFSLIRDGMRDKNVAALARTMLFRRIRTLLIQPYAQGMIATTLNFDYEINPADDAFGTIPTRKIASEMLDLAKHIIATKRGVFDPAGFDDRYDAALADLIKAKIDGKPIKRPHQAAEAKPIDLLDALRQSAAPAQRAKTAKSQKTTARSPNRRKAG